MIGWLRAEDLAAKVTRIVDPAGRDIGQPSITARVLGVIGRHVEALAGAEDDPTVREEMLAEHQPDSCDHEPGGGCADCGTRWCTSDSHDYGEPPLWPCPELLHALGFLTRAAFDSVEDAFWRGHRAGYDAHRSDATAGGC